jgi:hypothetical protein
MGEAVADKLTILIIGFDPYCDVWPYFDHYFSKNWPNCPFPKFFISSVSTFSSSCGIINLKTNGDLSVSGRINCGLQNIHTKWVLLLLEDYIMTRGPTISEVSSLLSYISAGSFSFFQLQNINDERDGKHRMGIEDKNIRNVSTRQKNYRLNMQPSIWDYSLLKSLCATKLAKPWDFEVSLCEGGENYKLGFSKKVGTIVDGPLHFVGFIEKGKYTLKARQMITQDNLPLPNRLFLTKHEEDRFRLRNFLSLHCPPFLKRAGKWLGRRFGDNYFSR